MWWQFLPFAAILALGDANIESQCMCEPYKKCEATLKPQLSFSKCLSSCKTLVGDEVPSEYPKCLSQFVHLMTNTMKCAHEAVGTGCTSNGKNVLRRHNFTAFEEIFHNDCREITEKVGVSFHGVSQAAQELNHCLLRCFFPAQNVCTSKLRCGLFMPNELRLMDNLVKCALHNDVSKGIMMEMASCMRIVMEEVVEEPVYKAVEPDDQ